MNNTPQVKAPWLKSKDPEVPAALTYSELSMCGRVEEMVRRYPDYIAYEFMGKCTTYAEMWKKINACAKSLKAIGIREGDKVTICMPNAPQTLCMFYAVNMVGAIANMVHPLSAESEIAFYLRDSGSVAAITLDQFYNKFESVRKAVDLPCLIITSVADELKPLMKVGYKLTEGRRAVLEGVPAPGRICGDLSGPPQGRGPRRHPVFRRHHWRDQGHPAVQPQLQRPGGPDHRHQPLLPARPQDAGHYAHVPRLRPGRVHPFHGGQRRPLHPDPPLHAPELCLSLIHI